MDVVVVSHCSSSSSRSSSRSSSSSSSSSSRSSSSEEIKLCNFSRSWLSKRSGEINFIINKKNNVFCLNHDVVNV